MSTHHIHIGDLILQKLREEKLSVAWLAAKINIDPSNLHKKLKKKSMDTDLLHQISKVLDYMFFQYYLADQTT